MLLHMKPTAITSKLGTLERHAFSSEGRAGWSLLSPAASEHVALPFLHFNRSLYTLPFFLPAHAIEKRHMETSMQTLQTFQLCFKTNANPFFQTSSPPPHPSPHSSPHSPATSGASSQESGGWFKPTQQFSASGRVPAHRTFFLLSYLITCRHRVTHSIPPRAWELLAWRAGISTSGKPHPDSNPPRVASYTSSPFFSLVSRKSPVLQAVKILLQACAEHYLGMRQARVEQTFTTERASAKTEIPGKLLVLAACQAHKLSEQRLPMGLPGSKCRSTTAKGPTGHSAAYPTT